MLASNTAYRYRVPVDYVFLKGENALIRVASAGTGQSGAIELYNKAGENVSTLVLKDPPVMAAFSEEAGLVFVLDKKKRVK